MSHIKLIGIIVACTASFISSFAQSSFMVNGYVKDLFSYLKPYQTDALIDNLIHQRTNVSWNAKKNWSASASLRTRFFNGDQAEIPFFGDLIDLNANDYLDLSVGFNVGEKGYFHSYFDRLYVDYSKEDWQFRLGRQRINWGINSIWNPNDLFNAYNYADFDYEERAGADALTVRYYYSALSDVQLAIRMFDDISKATIAIAWRTHKGEYDIQTILGYQNQQFVLGNGWAGNLGQWSFKGEYSIFVPLVENLKFGCNASIGFEYLTQKGVALNFSGLYNADGKTDGSLAELFIFTPSARNLYPFRWAIFTSVGYQVHPLVYINGAVIYSPVKANPLFLNPAVTWSVVTNLDMDFVFQIAFNEDSGKYITSVQGYFARIKWSF